jgi:hypothetical protein
VPANVLAHGYRWEDAQWKEEPLLSNGSFGSMGGMLTSVNDLGHYVEAFLAAWPPHDGREVGPIKRSSLREMQQVWRPAPASVTRDAAGAVQLNAGGYGFGLRVSQTCAFPLVVAHRRLPLRVGHDVGADYGIGIVAFATSRIRVGTRDGRARRAANACAIHPRSPHASPALTGARDAVSNLIVRWDDRARTTRRPGNVSRSDQGATPRRDRRAACDGRRVRPAAASIGGKRLRGQWTTTCERGTLQVAITLAPTMPPKVQYLVRFAPASPAPATTCR